MASLYDIGKFIFDSDPADLVVFNFMTDANDNFIKKVMQMFFEFINLRDADGNYLFLTQILLPTMTEVFDAANTPSPSHAAMIQWATVLLQNNHQVIVKTGCDERCYGRAWTSKTILDDAAARNPVIHLNEAWLTAAENSFQQYGNRNDYGHTDLFELNLHLIVFFLKFCHEFIHTLTRNILRYEYLYRSAGNGQPLSNAENCPYRSTPTKVGTKVKDATTFLGEMGFSLEEKVLGGNLRIFMEQDELWQPGNYFFEQGQIQVVHGKDHFYLRNGEINNMTRKAGYLSAIRTAFDNYHVNATVANGIALLGSFTVNLAHLSFRNVYDRPIPNIAKGRKYASAYGTGVSLEAVQSQTSVLYANPIFPPFDEEGDYKE